MKTTLLGQGLFNRLRFMEELARLAGGCARLFHLLDLTFNVVVLQRRPFSLDKPTYILSLEMVFRALLLRVCDFR